MAYTPTTWVAGEVVTATKMNLLSANQASFADGTGLGDDIILPRHLSDLFGSEYALYDYATFSRGATSGTTGMDYPWAPNIGTVPADEIWIPVTYGVWAITRPSTGRLTAGQSLTVTIQCVVTTSLLNATLMIYKFKKIK